MSTPSKSASSKASNAVRLTQRSVSKMKPSKTAESTSAAATAASAQGATAASSPPAKNQPKAVTGGTPAAVAKGESKEGKNKKVKAAKEEPEAEFFVSLLKIVEKVEGRRSGKKLAQLSKQNASVTLGDLRAALGEKLPSSHVFCYSNGEPEDDETTIAEYIENTEEDSDAAKAKPAAKEVKAEEQESVAESPSKETENVASAKGETAKATESPKKDGSSEKQTTPPSASEKQISAPSTDDKRTDISSFTIYVTESPEEGEDGGDDDEPEHDLGERLGLPEKKAKTFEAANPDFQEIPEQDEGMDENSKHASTLNTEEWQELLENSGAMCGWYVDREANRIVQAPKPAFRLRRSKPVAPPQSEQKPIEDVPSVDDSSDSDEDDTASTAQRTAQVSALMEASGEEPEESVLRPRFHVNDNSYVSITLASSQFEASMASNDFSSHSTEGSVKGGYGPFAATVSGGYAASKSNAAVQTNSTYKKTMIAKYMFPRATIYLDPSELEPTPELLESLFKISRTRSVIDMRKLHRDFGQLFCRQVTVGGRLLTTKIMDSTTNTSEQEQKEEYKGSVAASVSYAGVGSASVKHEQQGGKSAEQNVGQENKNESHSFEAVGGDTLLGTNPIGWTKSCAAYSNWRVIDRVNLTPMADAISEVPGLSNIKALFARAVPTLSRHMDMSQSREIKARLRLSTPKTQLSLSYLARDRDEYSEVSYYLGHAPQDVISPGFLRIRDYKKIWDAELDETSMATKLFYPSSFRAPAIYGRASKSTSLSAEVPKAPAATDKTKTATTSVATSTASAPAASASPLEEVVDTIWSITAPFDDALSHECRVILRTVPTPQPTKAGEPASQTSNPVALSVFRTQQGEFLPAMSDEDNGHIFRMLKRGEGVKRGETIQEGDDIRLSWRFEDQNVGFRDFREDVFGHRRHNWPSNVPQTPLYFKLPWPRFESILKPSDGARAIPNSMIMSPIASEDSIATTLSVIPAQRYGAKMTWGVQDLAFKLDVVEGNGREEEEDYMLLGAGAQRNGKGGSASQLAARFFLDTKV